MKVLAVVYPSDSAPDSLEAVLREELRLGLRSLLLCLDPAVL